MVTKVKDRPYFFLSSVFGCLFVMMTKKLGRSLTFVTILICMLIGTPSLQQEEFKVKDRTDSIGTRSSMKDAKINIWNGVVICACVVCNKMAYYIHSV